MTELAMEELNGSEINLVSGGNNARRHEIQRMRENLTGGRRDNSQFNCITASVVGASLGIFGIGGAMVGAGFGAYVCSQ